MITNTSSISLSCENPAAFFLRDTSEMECISTKLLTADAKVAVLCAPFSAVAPNGSYPPYAPYLANWQHRSLLTQENQSSDCPLNYVMQLVGLFVDNVTSWIDLNVSYYEDSDCLGDYTNPPSYLESKLEASNTTFTLGLSKSTTSCFPKRPKPFPAPYQKLDNYPLASFVTQNQTTAIQGEFCQTFTVEKRSKNLGDLKITCLGQAEGQDGLSSYSREGDILTCVPFLNASGKIQALASISYTPHSELGEFNDTSITINRRVLPCVFNDPADDEFKIRVIAGSMLGFIVMTTLGIMFYIRHKDAQPYEKIIS